MRKYIEDALVYFDYEPRDADFLLGAYDKIAENAEALKIFSDGLSLYENDFMCNQGEIIASADRACDMVGVHRYTAELLIYICMTKHAKKVYEEHGYSEKIYKDSMLDLRYKLEECKIVKGIIGSFVAGWFFGFFNLTRFTLGRLQFELIDFEKNYEKDGKRLTPQSRVINVHIPRDGSPMTPESCDAAFEQAKEIFGKEIDGDIAFVCHSWLLYPENKKILPSHTNTYKFMERFDVIESEPDTDGNDLWRLFDTDERNPDRLPADSSMRRAYIEHLKNGGSVGNGFGVFFA